MSELPSYLITHTGLSNVLWRVSPIPDGQFRWPPGDNNGFSFAASEIEEFKTLDIRSIENEWGLRIYGSDGISAYMFASNEEKL